MFEIAGWVVVGAVAMWIIFILMGAAKDRRENRDRWEDRVRLCEEKHRRLAWQQLQRDHDTAARCKALEASKADK